jgi:hypothetical protein
MLRKSAPAATALTLRGRHEHEPSEHTAQMTSSVPALEPWKTTEEEMFTIRYAKPGIDVCTHRIGIPTAPEVRQSSLVNPRPGIMTGPVTLPGSVRT